MDKELIKRLRSGCDNADIDCMGVMETGGIVLTMNEAANEIERINEELFTALAKLFTGRHHG